MTRVLYMELYDCVYSYASSMSRDSIKANANTGCPPDQLLMWQLYGRIENFLENYLESLSADGEYLMNEHFLRFYVHAWEQYKFSSTALDGICAFLNRTCLRRMSALRKEQCYEIYDLALILWNRMIIFKFKDQLINSVLQLIEKARNGEEIDMGLVRVALTSFVEVSVDNDDPSDKKPGLKTYETVFQSSFMEATQCYYRRVIAEYLDKHSALEYVKWVDVCLREEERRAQLYMHESTLKPLLAFCEKVLVEDRLEVCKTYSALISSEFENHAEFIRSLNNTCGKLVNSNPVTSLANSSAKSAELLARYCGDLLDKTSRNPHVPDIDDGLNDALILYKYLDDKDVFQEFYACMLARGYPVGPDFTAVVVTSCAWPFKEEATCNLPLTLQQCWHLFHTFYSGKYSSRKLTWLYSVSSGELATNCFKNTHTLKASMYRREDTSSQAASQLQSDAVLYLNENYRNKRVRVNINVPMKAQVKAEQETAYKTARDDRKLRIQATIVRIMKARRTLKHKDLVAEVLSQLSPRFKPEVLMVKACIDILLDKEYIERAPEDVDVYNYVA
ncbi:hypothetical protein HPB48_002322 [Haemaphysalis longicornis]|uniref:Cullin family profile domain-containing protein n=1 Tax=Haemaphysalis longicornis TaxID=44386 RepID=A0A9J6FPJ3_HAELO|nr:hypothetical protein HPB48_002322 [Haemaphysalis longicornis]